MRRSAPPRRNGCAPFTIAGTGLNADDMVIVLSPRQGQWAPTLTETYGILADTIATLPSQSEIDQITASLEAGLQAAAAGSATLQSGQLAGQLVNAVNKGEVVA